MSNQELCWRVRNEGCAHTGARRRMRVCPHPCICACVHTSACGRMWVHPRACICAYAHSYAHAYGGGTKSLFVKGSSNSSFVVQSAIIYYKCNPSARILGPVDTRLRSIVAHLRSIVAYLRAIVALSKCIVDRPKLVVALSRLVVAHSKSVVDRLQSLAPIRNLSSPNPGPIVAQSAIRSRQFRDPSSILLYPSSPDPTRHHLIGPIVTFP